VFFTAVKTTGIFCRPSCTARKPKPENVEFFAQADECLSAGYRACLHCKPLDAAAIAPDCVQKLLTSVDADPEQRWTDAQPHDWANPAPIAPWAWPTGRAGSPSSCPATG
jgi:AraC family transcriptional regulator of adaptative response/methylated-DNA-[protein]-cysteine methyltransferase